MSSLKSVTYRKELAQAGKVVLIVPHEAPCYKLARQRDYYEGIDYELEQAQYADFDFRGRVWFFWTNFLALRYLLVTFILAFQPGLMFSFLLLAIVGIATFLLASHHDCAAARNL
jgi:hypothetical protein